MRACAEQALRNMMDMYIYFLFMYVSQSNLVLPVSLSGLITLATPLRAAVLSRDDSILLSSDIFSDFKSCNDTCIVLSAASICVRWPGRSPLERKAIF